MLHSFGHVFNIHAYCIHGDDLLFIFDSRVAASVLKLQDDERTKF